MSEGIVSKFYNRSTLIVSFYGTDRYVPINGIFDSVSRVQVTADEIKNGDYIEELQGLYLLKPPKMFNYQPIADHYMFNHFKKSSLIDFSHFRITQTGERSMYLAIGIALTELIIASKDKSIVDRIRTLDFQGSVISNFSTYIETKINKRDHLNTCLYELSLRTSVVENFALDLLEGRNEENLFALLGIKLCKWDSYLKFISSNNVEALYSVNFMCLNQENWNILYKKDFYSHFVNDPESQKFLIDLKHENSILKLQESLEKSSIYYEQLLNNLAMKSTNSDVASEVLSSIKVYFTEYKSDSSTVFFEIFANVSCRNCKRITNNKQKVELSCSHIYCKQCFMALLLEKTGNKIVLNPEEKALLGEVTCNCSTPIKGEIIKKHCTNYEFYETEAKKRENYLCAVCNRRYPKDSFKTECKHSCDECTTEILNLLYQNCTICSTAFSENVIKSLIPIKSKCEKCATLISRTLCFPYKQCNHLYCFKCAKNFLKPDNSWNCPKGCQIKYLDPNMAYWYTKSQCSECASEYSRAEDMAMYKSCACKLCPKCISKNAENCPKCQVENSGYLAFLINEVKEQRKKQEKDCPICMEKYEPEKIIDFYNCSHYTCENCLKGSIKAAVEENEITKVFICNQCSAEMDLVQLEYLLSPIKKNLLGEENDENSTWNKINHRKIQMDTHLIECPKCRFNFIPDIIRLVRCMNPTCNFRFCKTCNEEYHQDDKTCQQDFINKRIKDMENAFPGQQISQCPQCKTPSLKDDKCNHVKCPDCKTEYCFVCSAIRSPILEHGNHYHRPQCTDYFEKGKDADVVKPKCTECQKKGALCDPPNNLAVRGRFGDGED